MYTLHVISLKIVGKSPQTLQGKRCNSYNQKYLQWPQLSIFRRFNEEKMHTVAFAASSSSVLVEIGLIFKKAIFYNILSDCHYSDVIYFGLKK